MKPATSTESFASASRAGGNWCVVGIDHQPTYQETLD